MAMSSFESFYPFPKLSLLLFRNLKTSFFEESPDFLFGCGRLKRDLFSGEDVTPDLYACFDDFDPGPLFATESNSFLISIYRVLQLFRVFGSFSFFRL